MHDYSEQERDFLSSLSLVMSASSNPRQLTQEVGQFWLRMLAGYEFSDVEMALAEHARRNKFCPAPADIIGLLPNRNNFLEPDEAWNHVPKSEYEGGYVCEEMMQAVGSVEGALSRNDHVGARMGFLECYRKLVAESVVQNKQAKYWYSGPTLGSLDMKAQIKEQAVVHAKTKKLISLERFNKDVNALEQKSVMKLENLANVAMLKSQTSDEEGRKRLAEIKKNRLS